MFLQSLEGHLRDLSKPHLVFSWPFAVLSVRLYFEGILIRPAKRQADSALTQHHHDHWSMVSQSSMPRSECLLSRTALSPAVSKHGLSEIVEDFGGRAEVTVGKMAVETVVLC